MNNNPKANAGADKSRLKPRLGEACLLFLALFIFGTPLPSQNPPTEYEVKAAYLYQFGKFVEWPDGALARSGGDFALCILGNDPFGSVLDETVSGRGVQGMKVLVRRPASVSDAAECNILFISSSEQNRLGEVLKLIQPKGVLTVGETKNFLLRGGMIQFQMEQNKVRFEVNLSAVQRANLKVSSQLLKIAKISKE